jgi:hypothetical protein
MECSVAITPDTLTFLLAADQGKGAILPPSKQLSVRDMRFVFHRTLFSS